MHRGKLDDDAMRACQHPHTGHWTLPRGACRVCTYSGSPWPYRCRGDRGRSLLHTLGRITLSLSMATSGRLPVSSQVPRRLGLAGCRSSAESVEKVVGESHAAAGAGGLVALRVCIHAQ